MGEKEFKVNDLITLKLEGEDTVIYVNGKKFNQCKRLIIEIYLEEVEEYDDIDSIDEASKLHASIHKRKGMETEAKHVEISPETEFWGHCSNLQAWVENDYNTRLLHSNLSFPLLKIIADSGDVKAKKSFESELKERLESRYLPIVLYLIRRGYLKYLTDEALWKHVNFIPSDDKRIYLAFLAELVKRKDGKARELIFKEMTKSPSDEIEEFIIDLIRKFFPDFIPPEMISLCGLALRFSHGSCSAPSRVPIQRFTSRLRARWRASRENTTKSIR
ncbi:MAG: hypothetical protein ACFFCS_23415 [Candidatus Hodarchaeota archaeon]